MAADVRIKERIEVFWGAHHGGWIKGQVVAKAGPGDEIIEMEDQPTKVQYPCRTLGVIRLRTHASFAAVFATD